MAGGGPSKNKSSEEHIAAQRMSKRNRGGGKGSVKKTTAKTIAKAMRLRERQEITMQAMRKPLLGMTVQETIEHNLEDHEEHLMLAAKVNNEIGRKIRRRTKTDEAFEAAEAQVMTDEIGSGA